VVHTRYWSRIVFDRRTILTFEEVDLTFLNKNKRKLNASVGMKIARIKGRSATTGYKTMGIRELDMYVSSFFFLRWFREVLPEHGSLPPFWALDSLTIMKAPFRCNQLKPVFKEEILCVRTVSSAPKYTFPFIDLPGRRTAL